MKTNKSETEIKNDQYLKALKEKLILRKEDFQGNKVHANFNVPEELYRKFKTTCFLKHMKIQDAGIEAITLWMKLKRDIE